MEVLVGSMALRVAVGEEGFMGLRVMLISEEEGVEVEVEVEVEDCGGLGRVGCGGCGRRGRVY